MRCGEGRLVLRGGDGNAERAAAVPRRERRADDREVVGFRASGGEHDLIRLDADGGGDRALRLFDARARCAPEPVR